MLHNAPWFAQPEETEGEVFDVVEGAALADTVTRRLRIFSYVLILLVSQCQKRSKQEKLGKLIASELGLRCLTSRKELVQLV